MTQKHDIDRLPGNQLEWQLADYTQPPELGTELHVWALPLTLDGEQQQQALQWLNPLQRDKYARRKGDQAKACYLAGRYYLLQLLAGYQGMEAGQINLRYSRLSKPALDPNPLGLEFNFSDTRSAHGDWGIFAFCAGSEVGIDIEAFGRASELEKIAERRFSAAEMTWVRDTDGNIDQQRFLAIWTRKEAYGKAIGQGINFSMQALDLAGEGQHDFAFRVPEQSGEFQLNQFQIFDRHIAAVVYRRAQALPIKAFSLTKAIP